MELAAWLNFLSPDGPYWGPEINMVPGNPTSLSLIDGLVRSSGLRKGDRVHVLEIGSYVGASALTWSHALRDAGADYVIYCADIWRSIDMVHHRSSSTMISNERNSFNQEIFRFNIEKSMSRERVIEVVGDSGLSLEALRDKFFDFIYVDAFHGKDAVLKDLHHATRLCKIGGVICGDDYDCPPELMGLVPKAAFQDDDWRGLHPGVVAAVNEILGPPRQFGSFWAFRRCSDGFEALEVADLPRRIPDFIPPDSVIRRRFEDALSQPSGYPANHPMAIVNGPLRLVKLSAAGIKLRLSHAKHMLIKSLRSV